MSKTRILIEGMKCDGCASRVESFLENTPGVSSVEVDLEKGEAEVEHKIDTNQDALKEAVSDAGYTPKDIHSIQ